MNISQYFEKRQKTYPQNVSGKFRRVKNIISFICLAIFFFAPFLRWDRGEFAPDQAILIDIVNSRAYFFFIEMWPEEAYWLTAILIFAAIGLFFITSLFGRVWCGYSCFQTVWTDLFVKIERFFQGDRNDRIKLDRKGFSWQNIWRKIATHFSWWLVGFLTGLAFVAYFNDAPTLIKNLLALNLSEQIWGWILGVAFATYIMAGFAREQVCNYMCPYARFQSAMFDPDTLIISYDAKRGEPRGKYKKDADFDQRGHCIDCKQCVVVCPQNIDIRNGLQMECIACGLCIDACNNVMEKFDLPKNLIRYDTEANLAANVKEDKKFRILRPRTFFYTAILLIVAIFIISNLAFKLPAKIDVLPDRNPMFVMLSNGDIRNGYMLKISNKTHKNKSYSLEVIGIEGLEIMVKESKNIDKNNLPVKAGQVEGFRIYLIVQEKYLLDGNNRRKIDFILTDKDTGQSFDVDSVFIEGLSK